MKDDVRLINANALTRWLEMNKSNAHPLDYSTKGAYASCITMVGAMESIDAVPVVRCRECIYRGSELECPMCHDEYYYDEDDGGDWVTHDKTPDDGFCHKGKREADDV